jgi:hypothetical protein
MGLAETIIEQGIEGALLILILVLCYKIYRLEIECSCCNKNIILRTNYNRSTAPIHPYRDHHLSNTQLSNLENIDPV